MGQGATGGEVAEPSEITLTARMCNQVRRHTRDAIETLTAKAAADAEEASRQHGQDPRDKRRVGVSCAGGAERRHCVLDTQVR